MRTNLLPVKTEECRESFGYVIIESLAFGTPVIASNIGGIKEIIKNEYNGLLFEPGSHIELEESIKEDLDQEDKSIASLLEEEGEDGAT